MLILALALLSQAPSKPYKPPETLRVEAEYHELYMTIRAAATRSERDALEEAGGVTPGPDDPRNGEILEAYRKKFARRLKEVEKRTGKTFDELEDILAEGFAREWHLESKDRTVRTAEEARAEVAERRRTLANLRAMPLLGKAIEAAKEDRAAAARLYRRVEAEFPDTDAADIAREWLEKFDRRATKRP